MGTRSGGVWFSILQKRQCSAKAAKDAAFVHGQGIRNIDWVTRKVALFGAGTEKIEEIHAEKYDAAPQRFQDPLMGYERN